MGHFGAAAGLAQRALESRERWQQRVSNTHTKNGSYDELVHLNHTRS